MYFRYTLWFLEELVEGSLALLLGGEGGGVGGEGTEEGGADTAVESLNTRLTHDGGEGGGDGGVGTTGGLNTGLDGVEGDGEGPHTQTTASTGN